MIIGFDASRAFIDKKTGTENYSYQLLKNLALLDHKNTYYILLRPDYDARGYCNELSTGVAGSGVPHRAPAGPIVIGPRMSDGAANRQDPKREETQRQGPEWPSNFHFKTLPYPRLWTQLGLAIETFKSPLDVLFVPSHTLPLVHRPGLKTVLTVHDLGAEYLPQTHQIKQRLYLNFMTHQQLKSATHLIAVSEATKADIVRRVGIPKEKISVVYEGFDEKVFKPSKKDTLRNSLKQYDLQPKNYFLFVGTIQPRKNLERLIRAYAQFLKWKGWLARGTPVECPQGVKRPRTSDGGKARQDPDQTLPKLVLAGSKGWLSDEIYKLPKKLGIEDQVKFLGFVPDQDLPALYSGAQAFLFPSLFEGFGIPILEAMACGCPVITSNLSSMPEIAGKAAILVDPYSVESISQSLVKISKDNTLQSNLLKLGFQQVKKFSWEKCAKETLEILDKVSTQK